MNEQENKGIEFEDLSEDGSSQLTNSSEEEEEVNWINWFISLKGNEFFCEIDEDYIQDDFNLTGLSAMVPFYDYALDMMLDIEIPTNKLTEDQLEIVETAAEVLYGLIHARYILSIKGMNRMKEKFSQVDFGRCPRVFCQGQPVLPVGISDVPRNYCVNTFCPRCRDIFYPKSARQANLDGAYFGTTFCHLFLMVNIEQLPSKIKETYSPRIFGFRVHKKSAYWNNRDNDDDTNDKSSKTKGKSGSKSSSSPSKASATVLIDTATGADASNPNDKNKGNNNDNEPPVTVFGSMGG